MQKLIFFAAISIVLISSANAQSIGIGTTTPNNSAILDVSSTNKGMLAPRMTTAQRVAIASPANGLMVYDLTTNGFWYYNGNIWINLTAPASGTGWSLNGNSGTTPATNFIGTTDNQPLLFKLNNQRYGLLHPNGNIFMGYIAGEQNTTGTFNTAIGKQ